MAEIHKRVRVSKLDITRELIQEFLAYRLPGSVIFDWCHCVREDYMLNVWFTNQEGKFDHLRVSEYQLRQEVLERRLQIQQLWYSPSS